MDRYLHSMLTTINLFKKGQNFFARTMYNFIEDLNVEQSKKERKLRFSYGFFGHLNDIVSPVVLLLILLFLLTQLFLNLKSPESKPIIIISVLIILFLALLIVVIRELLKINALTELETDFTKQQNKQFIAEIADGLGWSLLEENKEYFIFRNSSKGFNGGEIVTTIFDDNLVLINSTSCPILNNLGGNRSPLSFGSNVRNIKKIKIKLSEKSMS